jgi:hypothetical protein
MERHEVVRLRPAAAVSGRARGCVVRDRDEWVQLYLLRDERHALQRGHNILVRPGLLHPAQASRIRCGNAFTRS